MGGTRLELPPNSRRILKYFSRWRKKRRIFLIFLWRSGSRGAKVRLAENENPNQGLELWSRNQNPWEPLLETENLDEVIAFLTAR